MMKQLLGLQVCVCVAIVEILGTCVRGFVCLYVVLRCVVLLCWVTLIALLCVLCCASHTLSTGRASKSQNIFCYEFFVIDQ